MKKIFFIAEKKEKYRYCVISVNSINFLIEENSDFNQMIEDFQDEYGDIEKNEGSDYLAFFFSEVSPGEIKSAVNHFVSFFKEINIKIKEVFYSETFIGKADLDEILDCH